MAAGVVAQQQKTGRERGVHGYGDVHVGTRGELLLLTWTLCFSPPCTMCTHTHWVLLTWTLCFHRVQCRVAHTHTHSLSRAHTHTHTHTHITHTLGTTPTHHSPLRTPNMCDRLSIVVVLSRSDGVCVRARARVSACVRACTHTKKRMCAPPLCDACSRGYMPALTQTPGECGSPLSPADNHT